MCHAPCLQAIPAPASHDALLQPLRPTLHDVRHCLSCRSSCGDLHLYNLNGAKSESLAGWWCFARELPRASQCTTHCCFRNNRCHSPHMKTMPVCVLTHILRTCWFQNIKAKSWQGDEICATLCCSIPWPGISRSYSGDLM